MARDMNDPEEHDAPVRIQEVRGLERTASRLLRQQSTEKLLHHKREKESGIKDGRLHLKCLQCWKGSLHSNNMHIIEELNNILTPCPHNMFCQTWLHCHCFCPRMNLVPCFSLNHGMKPTTDTRVCLKAVSHVVRERTY